MCSNTLYGSIQGRNKLSAAVHFNMKLKQKTNKRGKKKKEEEKAAEG